MSMIYGKIELRYLSLTKNWLGFCGQLHFFVLPLFQVKLYTNSIIKKVRFTVSGPAPCSGA